MGANMDKFLEKVDADFTKISSKEAWTKEDVELMKDLQKLMYYVEVRCAMKEGGEYPGSEYMDNDSSFNSYARGQARNVNTGRYMSRTGRGGNNGGSGAYPYSYDDMRGSGRRYYDDSRDNTMNHMRHIMETEQDPEVRMILKRAMKELEEG